LSLLTPRILEIPEIPGVKVAFLGYIPAQDFIAIISDDAGDDILDSIFYDNVRDWQDYNAVNSEMRDTLASPKKARFVLMNNGVTIIAKKLKQSGSKFYIEGFQIVNGRCCAWQTSARKPRAPLLCHFLWDHYMTPCKKKPI
jgi:AIPR protein